MAQLTRPWHKKVIHIQHGLLEWDSNGGKIREKKCKVIVLYKGYHMKGLECKFKNWTKTIK